MGHNETSCPILSHYSTELYMPYAERERNRSRAKMTRPLCLVQFDQRPGNSPRGQGLPLSAGWHCLCTSKMTDATT
jgi:hypothetical protein